LGDKTHIFGAFVGCHRCVGAIPLASQLAVRLGGDGSAVLLALAYGAGLCGRRVLLPKTIPYENLVGLSLAGHVRFFVAQRAPGFSPAGRKMTHNNDKYHAAGILSVSKGRLKHCERKSYLELLRRKTAQLAFDILKSPRAS
jgi:hypothetical protein